MMRNCDVYSIALHSENLVLLGVNKYKSVPPLVPVKIEALCGRGIQGNNNYIIQVATALLILRLVFTFDFYFEQASVVGLTMSPF